MKKITLSLALMGQIFLLAPKSALSEGGGGLARLAVESRAIQRFLESETARGWAAKTFRATFTGGMTPEQRERVFLSALKDRDPNVIRQVEDAIRSAARTGNVDSAALDQIEIGRGAQQSSQTAKTTSGVFSSENRALQDLRAVKRALEPRVKAGEISTAEVDGFLRAVSTLNRNLPQPVLGEGVTSCLATHRPAAVRNFMQLMVAAQGAMTASDAYQAIIRRAQLLFGEGPEKATERVCSLAGRRQDRCLYFGPAIASLCP